MSVQNSEHTHTHKKSLFRELTSGSRCPLCLVPAQLCPSNCRLEIPAHEGEKPVGSFKLPSGCIWRGVRFSGQTRTNSSSIGRLWEDSLRSPPHGADGSHGTLSLGEHPLDQHEVNLLFVSSISQEGLLEGFPVHRPAGSRVGVSPGREASALTTPSGPGVTLQACSLEGGSCRFCPKLPG